MNIPMYNQFTPLLGEFPHLSRGNYSNEYKRPLWNIHSMDITREYQLDIIEKKTKQLGLNKHKLEIIADIPIGSIKDLRRGKRPMDAKKWNRILNVLSPPQEEDKNKSDEKELGLRKGLEMVILALISRGRLPKDDLESLFNYQLREFRARNQSTAAGVMDQLLDFLHSGLSSLEHPKDSQSPALPNRRSKKEKASGE